MAKARSSRSFFEVVDDVTPAQQQQVREVMNSEHPRLIDLPDNIRARDALGESCHMQLVVDSSSNQVLKFFDASVPIAWDVVRVFCNNHPKVINYKVANNSDRVKCAFLYMLKNITGEQGLTQSLGQKALTHG